MLRNALRRVLASAPRLASPLPRAAEALPSARPGIPGALAWWLHAPAGPPRPPPLPASLRPAAALHTSAPALGVSVEVDGNLDRALRKLKRRLIEEKIAAELKERTVFVKPSQERVRTPTRRGRPGTRLTWPANETRS